MNSKQGNEEFSDDQEITSFSEVSDDALAINSSKGVKGSYIAECYNYFI